MAATGWDPRFPDGNGEFGVAAKHDRRDAAATDVTIRSRAVRLLEYLEAVHGMREQPVRDIADYQDRCWWAGDIPTHPSCVLTATGEEPWLKVSKAELPPASHVPADVAAHLRIGVTDAEREPAFAAEFDEAFADDSEQAARLKELLREYVEGSWRAWAVRAKTALRARKLYEDLYDLRLRLQRESAHIELVWAHGILSWTVDGTRIVHPMVTTQVQLSFDPDTGTLTVEPEALIPHLEIDVLQGLGMNGFDLLVDLRDRFRMDPVGPFDERSRNLYEQLLAPLGLDGRTVEGTVPAPASSEPTITATWVLLVRRRSTMFRRFFAGLRDLLTSEETAVPAPLAAVVADEPSRLDQDRPGDESSWGHMAERLLMPLPTNPEQEQVARRLAEHRGVTVQGPPGTGKTHTIANLVSHLVGHGKRVLVTSQKEQTLPASSRQDSESIRDLSVAVLGASADFTRAARSIRSVDLRAGCRYGPEPGPGAAGHIGLPVSTNCSVMSARLRTRISDSIAREQDSYTVGTAIFSPSTLGQWLAVGAAELGFIPDQVDPSDPCPLWDRDR